MTVQGSDMLKYLTQKFRSQTLNEIQPFQNKGDEDHDSGTESDEDIHDLEDVDDSVSVCSHHFCCTCNQSSMSRTTTHEISEYSLDSISCTSDYERQSLDFERHSSEEELSTIHKEVASEKRKWSHAHSSSCDSTGSVDEEVKELMLEPQPIMFSSSPPKDVSVGYTISFDHDNEQTCEGTIRLIVGPESHNSNFRPESHNSNFRSENPCDEVLNNDKRKHQTSHSKLTFPKGAVPALISPRKRHRKISVSENGSEYQSFAMRRPSLDFEKMQKNAVKKQCVHSVGKAKVVKIKTVSGGNAVTSKCLSDPSIFSFRSISSVRYGQLTPVEQPPCAH